MSGITIANLTFTILNFLILLTFIIAGIIANNELQKAMNKQGGMANMFKGMANIPQDQTKP